MKQISQIFLTLFTFTLVLIQGNEDKGRPYEFGFTIDGEQHRHEKRDEKGIVQGEFGFITADGIYHVTVYATDENGKFKILSTRNIRISAPLDGSPLRGEISPEAEKYRKKAGLSPLPTQPSLISSATHVAPVYPGSDYITPIKEAPYRFTTQATVKPACAGCGYVTTQAPIAGQNGNGFQFQNPVFQQQDQQQQLQQQQYPSPNYPQNNQYQESQNLQYPQYPHTGTAGVSPTYQGVNGPQYTNYQTGVSQQPGLGIGNGLVDNSNFGGSGGFGQNNAYGSNNVYGNYNGQNVGGNLGAQEGGQQNQIPYPIQGPSTSVLPPISVSGGSIHVGGAQPQDIPIRDKFPGMQDGLPTGIEEKDITDLLYKFHYTVGFHGHYEKGLKNGAKVGGYFVNGRDGISRVVTYVADENGYRPKVKLINLGLDSEDTPKPDSEKKFGLKSFEFIWYPIA